MRILELRLTAFGPFTDLTLDFSRDRSGVDLIYGPNEAGKSASLRALTALFYGVPVRTADNFRHDNKSLRVGARIRHSDGSELDFTRRKGNKDTLLDQRGKPIADTALTKFLDGAAQDLFATMFGIDHESLIQGGEQILEGGGVVGESLFAAAMGGANLRDVLRGLEEEAAQLFLPKGRTQAIPRGLAAYKETKQRSLQASLSSRQWAEHDAALRQALSDQAEIDAALRQLKSDTNRLQRYHKALPGIAEREELLAKLNALGRVKILPAAFAEQRREAQRQLTEARAVQQSAAAALQQIGAKIELLILPEALLQEAENVLSLYEQLGSHRKAYKDLSRLQGEKRQLVADARADLKELFPDVLLDQVERLRLTAAQRIRIRELGNGSQTLHDRLRTSGREVKKIELRLTTKRQLHQELEPQRDAAELKAAVVKAQKQGELEQELATATAAGQVRKQQLDLELQKLGLWSGTLEQLEELSVPTVEAIDRFDSIWATAEQRLQNLVERIRETELWLQELTAKINTLRLAGPVPSEEELRRARQRREAGWRLVRRGWLEGQEDPEEIHAFDPDNSLPKAYENSVAGADTVADRLRWEADRVAGEAALLAQQQKYQAELEGYGKDKQQLEREMRLQQQSWLDLWQPAGIPPLTAREMRSWLMRQERLAQEFGKWRADQQRLALLRQRIETHRAVLQQCLGQLGEPGETAAETLEKTIDRGLLVVGHIEKTARERKDLQEAIRQLEEDLAMAVRSREEASDALATWQTEWRREVAVLGLTDAASPGEANVVLERMEELFKRVDKIAGLESRISSILRDGEQFAGKVRELAGRIAVDLSELPPESAVVALNDRLAKARQDSATLVQLQAQREEKQELLEKAQRTIQTSQLRLQQLCAEAGTDNDEELERMEQRSTLAQALHKDIEALEKRLLDYSGGAPVDLLIRETEGLDADALPFQITELEGRSKALEQQRAEILESIGREKNQLDMMDGRGEAAEAAERAQAILTEVREAANRYLRLRLAAVILYREIERYRSENQDPLLKRASELFRELTLESFDALETDFNEADAPILVAVRNGGEKVPVQGMSEGTRDQLYLSLRLASLEKYLQYNEPMPFIVDDILVNFDNQRAEATLKVLHDLSSKMQVLFFTHHAHLVDLARRVVPDAALQVHSLMPCG